MDWEKEWDAKFGKSLERPLAWQGGKVLTTENAEAKYFIKKIIQTEKRNIKKLLINNNVLKQKIENIKRIIN